MRRLKRFKRIQVKLYLDLADSNCKPGDHAITPAYKARIRLGGGRYRDSCWFAYFSDYRKYPLPSIMLWIDGGWVDLVEIITDWVEEYDVEIVYPSP